MLSKLKNTLDARYGKDWPEMELETISLDLGHVLTPAMLSQLSVLKGLAHNPHLFETDASYFLRFVEAANGHYVDPTVVYMPNSLELAWGLYELKRIVPGIEFSHAITRICHYILSDEGYGSAPPPFDFITEPFENQWETPEAARNKAEAIRLYGLAMERL
jgi:hypothetical protein